MLYKYELPENFEETIANLKSKGNEFYSSETIKAYSSGTVKEAIKDYHGRIWLIDSE